jgi:hypothetical protein
MNSMNILSEYVLNIEQSFDFSLRNSVHLNRFRFLRKKWCAFNMRERKFI